MTGRRPPPLAPLPIDDVLPQVVEALRDRTGLVVQAPTGAGKTTRVPPALLDAGLAGSRQVVMLEPRRLAARAAARRMADERGEPLGRTIGYHVRFDRQAGPDTRVLVATEGLLLRMLIDDPFLDRVGAVVFDEFHERSLDADLALGMTRLLQQTVRPDLRIVVMSATIAAGAAAKYLDDCPVVVSQGRLHPVEIEYAPRSSHQPWPAAIEQAVERLLQRTPGDLLVFLPGVGEIRQTQRALDPLARQSDLLVAPLYGDLPADQQDAALCAGERRRIVLATNVAETSVTVEGVTGVVDTGLARQNRFDPHVGLDRLDLVQISQASAEQRAGRAGRLRPGVCIRLWNSAQHKGRAEHTEPEIRRVDLAGAVLQLAALGENDPAQFPWLDPPHPAAVAQARRLLERLGALDDRGPTPLGRLLARLPLHPRLARLLVEGARFGRLQTAALAAALLAERDPFPRMAPDRGGVGARSTIRAASDSDVADRVEYLEEFAETGRVDTPLGTLHKQAARTILQARSQLVRQFQAAERDEPSVRPEPVRDDAEALGRALLAAFPDRVARRREPGGARALLVGGRGVRLDPHSAVTRAELFLALDVDGGQSDAVVRVASAVDRRWLPASEMTTGVEAFFDETAGRVAARRRVRYGDLLLEESTAPLPDAEQVAETLASAASTRLEQALPPADSDGGRLLTRLRCLRAWMPELDLPAYDDEFLKGLLPQVAYGRRSLEELREGPWCDALRSPLDARQRQSLERDAPARLTVPSGSQIALVYEEGRPPVLAVRIQELFGWRDSPRIAGGRVRVLLHLLGPNYRPQQVTDDLVSFWNNGYPVIRKELRRRYPKHSWPEDPWTAVAERKPGRRP